MRVVQVRAVGKKWGWPKVGERAVYTLHYSRFQLTFHANVPNFVCKFASSL